MVLNRSFKLFVSAIAGVGYLLRLLPMKMQCWSQFITPDAFKRWAAEAGLGAAELSGLQYNPFTRRHRLGGDLQVIIWFTLKDAVSRRQQTTSLSPLASHRGRF